MSSTSATIRPATVSDNPSLSQICLLTGAAGSSAEASHSIPELLGLIYAVPYTQVETTFGFVLVDGDSSERESKGRIVGYILGTTDTTRYEEITEQEWWPTLRDKYPKLGSDSLSPRTPADERFISHIHAPTSTPADITRHFPAHIHIDILPSHQHKSYGRQLMAHAVAYLRERGHTGLFVGLDPANEGAKAFYARLGFDKIEKEGGEWWELEFERFRE